MHPPSLSLTLSFSIPLPVTLSSRSYSLSLLLALFPTCSLPLSHSLPQFLIPLPRSPSPFTPSSSSSIMGSSCRVQLTPTVLRLGASRQVASKLILLSLWLMFCTLPSSAWLETISTATSSHAWRGGYSPSYSPSSNRIMPVGVILLQDHQKAQLQVLTLEYR